MGKLSTEVTKNTISQGLQAAKTSFEKKATLAVGRALQVIRKEIVTDPFLPVVSGRYKNSIQGKSNKGIDESIYNVTSNPTDVVGVVGTNVPYAKRLEYGFNGNDSLGRKINQTPGGYFERGFKKAKTKVKLVIDNTMKI